MIALFTGQTLPEIPCGSSFVGLKIAATLAAYQTGYSFFMVWVQWQDNAPTAWIAKLEQTVFLAAEDTADFEEIRNFFAAIEFDSLQAEASAMRRLSYAPYHRYPILLREEPMGVGGAYTALPLRPIYDILFAEENDALHQAPFDAWYVDLSHRIRHQTAIAVMEQQAAVAVASHIVRDAAVISGVATLPAERGKGLATRALERLIGQTNVRNFFVSSRPEALSFYQKNKFVPVGEFAIYYTNEGLELC